LGYGAARTVTNIPTDLLRTLVAVVDQRSFTKAAASLGVTQPAVSAQIKRLQFLLGGDLLDRSAPGVALTARGELVVSYARRLLSINDQIVNLGDGTRPELAIRIGTPSEYVASILPNTLARLRNEWPEVRFVVRTGVSEPLMRDLRNGELDLYIGLSTTAPHDARSTWADDVVWVRSEGITLVPGRPVPLISFGEPNIYRDLVTTALKAGGYDWEDVFWGPSIASLRGALSAGLGVMAIARRRAIEHGMTIWDDAPLPKLPGVHAGVYVREGGAGAIYEQLADEIVTMMRGPEIE